MRNVAVAALGAVMAAGIAMAEPVEPGSVAYQDGAVEKSLTGVPGDPESGRMVMSQRSMGNCVACHQVTALSDVQWHGEVGPPLDGAGDRWSKAELRGIVADAKMMFDGSIMPSFYKNSGYIRPGDGFTGKAAQGTLPPLLTAQQIEDVVAFLATLKE